MKIRLREWVSLELSLIDVLVSTVSFIMQGSSTQLLLRWVICHFLGAEDANTLPTVLEHREITTQFQIVLGKADSGQWANFHQ